MYYPWSSFPDNARERGAWAEDRAMWYLRFRGWRICARNWIGGGGELDIVASRWRTLLICEVRFRSCGLAFASIDDEKVLHIQYSSRALVRHHHLQKYHVRLDAIAVDNTGNIEWRRDIIQLHPNYHNRP